MFLTSRKIHQKGSKQRFVCVCGREKDRRVADSWFFAFDAVCFSTVRDILVSTEQTACS